MHDASTCDSRTVCHDCGHRLNNAPPTAVDKHALEFTPVFAWCID